MEVYIAIGVVVLIIVASIISKLNYYHTKLNDSFLKVIDVEVEMEERSLLDGFNVYTFKSEIDHGEFVRVDMTIYERQQPCKLNQKEYVYKSIRYY